MAAMGQFWQRASMWGAAVAVVVVAGTGVAKASNPSGAASIPDASDNELHLCFDSGDAKEDPGGSPLSIIDKPVNKKDCGHKKELEINQRGPQGVQGPAGPAGPVGSRVFAGEFNGATLVIWSGTAPFTVSHPATGKWVVHIPAGTFAPTGGIGNGCPIPLVGALGGGIVLDMNICGPITTPANNGSVDLYLHSTNKKDNHWIMFTDTPVS